MNNIYVKFQIDFLFVYKKYGLLKFSFQKTVYVFLSFFYLSGCSFFQNLRIFSNPPRTQTHKSFHLSSHNTSLLRLPLLLYHTLPLSFHGKSPGRILIFDNIPTLPMRYIQRTWKPLCLSTLENSNPGFQTNLPLFPKGNTPGMAELCSRKPTVIITLFTYATSIAYRSDAPDVFPSMVSHLSPATAVTILVLGKCTVSPEITTSPALGFAYFVNWFPRSGQYTYG